MPATELVWRNLKAMHVVFAASSVAMFGATVWMVAADYDDQWRTTQRVFDEIEATKLEQELQSVETPEYSKQRETLESEIAAQRGEAQEELRASGSKWQELQKEVAELGRQVDLQERTV